MAAWADTNARIRQCRASANPIACLTQLFEQTRDGHVAMALGESYKALGQAIDARRWFEEAERRYPLADYKRRARGALDSLGSVVPTSSQPVRPGTSTDTLHVVSCSRQKAWDDPGIRDRFLPARQAYTGLEITSWLNDPASRTARWLILSAKYGFIEPDHPIANYDVTFNDPATGPITANALRAQVEHQTRWPEKIPLRGFSRVVVHGSASYVAICRQAFESIASVSKDGIGEEQESGLKPVDASLTVDDGRAAAVAAALAIVAEEVFETFDRREPEWPVLERLSAWSHPRGLLAAVAFALTDYQLGTGGATVYWNEIAGLLPDRQELRSSAELLKFFESLVARPVSARMADQKLARIKRLMTSAVVEKVRGASMQALGQDPVPLWHALASAMEQPLDAKTIVFSMKIFDLLHCICQGKYANFGDRVPVIADLRIARLSFSAGLVRPGPGVSVPVAMSDAGALLQSDQRIFIDAWSNVSRLAGGLNLFRVDSLAWQLAQPIHEKRDDRRAARTTTEGVLKSAGASSAVAARLSTELTFSLEPAQV